MEIVIKMLSKGSLQNISGIDREELSEIKSLFK